MGHTQYLPHFIYSYLIHSMSNFDVDYYAIFKFSTTQSACKANIRIIWSSAQTISLSEEKKETFNFF